MRDEVAIMAWVQFIPLAVAAVQAGIGARREGQKRRRMDDERARWHSENTALFNRDFYGDFTQRADAQNIIRQMRNEMDRQSNIERNTQAVLGTTNEVALANKEARNRAMTDIFGNLASQGQRFKDMVQNRYLNRKFGVQGLDYDRLGQMAQSSNNLLHNGVRGLAGSDWASIVQGFQPRSANNPNSPNAAMPKNWANAGGQQQNMEFWG